MYHFGLSECKRIKRRTHFGRVLHAGELGRINKRFWPLEMSEYMGLSYTPQAYKVVVPVLIKMLSIYMGKIWGAWEINYFRSYDVIHIFICLALCIATLTAEDGYRWCLRPTHWLMYVFYV